MFFKVYLWRVYGSQKRSLSCILFCLLILFVPMMQWFAYKNYYKQNCLKSFLLVQNFKIRSF